MERGVDEKRATHIFDLMEKFAGYGFNKSHSAAYALVAYQTAWLKAHYPAAFMAAVLSSDMDHTDKVVIFIEECRNLKIPVQPPNINRSQYKFTVTEDNQILYGLGAIKGVGEAAIQSIIEARNVRPFADIFDFCARVDARRVSRRTMDALIRSGAMDCLSFHSSHSFQSFHSSNASDSSDLSYPSNAFNPSNRAELMYLLEDAMTAAEQMAKNRKEGQVDLFGDSFSVQDVVVTKNIKPIGPWSKQMIFEGEKETLGFYFSGHPLEQFDEELRRLTSSTISNLSLDNRRVTVAGLVANVRTLNTKKGDRMAFIALDDRTGRQEVAIFSDLYRLKRDLLVKDNLLIVEGEISHDEFSGGFKMRSQNIYSLEEARSRAAKFLKIQVESEQISQELTQQLLSTLKPAKGGNTCVRVFYKQGQATGVLKLSDEWRVSPKQDLIEKLKGIFGETAVEMCY